MPVRVEKRDNEHCVVNVDTGETEKCYTDEDKAKAYAAALNLAHANAQGYVHNDRPLDNDVVEELNDWDA